MKNWFNARAIIIYLTVMSSLASYSYRVDTLRNSCLTVGMVFSIFDNKFAVRFFSVEVFLRCALFRENDEREVFQTSCRATVGCDESYARSVASEGPQLPLGHMVEGWAGR